MSTDPDNTASESDFEHIGLENLSMAGSEFAIIQDSTSTSEWEVVSAPGSPKECLNTPINEGVSAIHCSSHPLTIENLSLKTIDEVAGGSIHKYQQLFIADLKRYERMSLSAKFWSWWTKKELAIFDAQILKELKEHDAKNKVKAQGVGNDGDETISETRQQDCWGGI
ncbi:hypothetical protein L207DRAFT_529079 [Hyaloscypha variabilis F]|uniref:Uncharacterized protein n=1 Tax=Hyaloscypha variabilis (strain UAMH 11265 / GT02V1 / F) TaxID=1149755 RepID=A0A2J6RQH8_HYAVF|nr:hypothetical protein L207DRAFT_529079 [Hyaloscypha variabilis F]